MLWALLATLVACGGDGDARPERPEPAGSAEATPGGAESPQGFLGYGYKTVDPKTCDNTTPLGKRERITIEAPDTVGTTIFLPGCVTDVKGERVEITLNNTSTNLHNIIVEGNEGELVTGAGEKASMTFELALDDDQIGFQCTIHDRMYGAFFR